MPRKRRRVLLDNFVELPEKEEKTELEGQDLPMPENKKLT
jgi:hypothetical protein